MRSAPGALATPRTHGTLGTLGTHGTLGTRGTHGTQIQIEIMDFYVILGLGPGASSAEIKRAYRRLSRRYHPGVNPGDQQAQAVFERVTQAYETLSDPARRREYDAAGGLSAPTAQSNGFEFAGFDFSFAAHGTDAATFSEL